MFGKLMNQGKEDKLDDTMTNNRYLTTRRNANTGLNYKSTINPRLPREGGSIPKHSSSSLSSLIRISFK